MKTLGLLFFALLFSLNLWPQRVKVVGVVDGDTFTALFADNHVERVRLHGIDCPENGQPYSGAARKFASGLLFGKFVFIKPLSFDRYGRTVAIAYSLPGNQCVNEKILEAGFAWHFTRYDKNVKWQQIEDRARADRRGIWGGTEQPIAPWNWRRATRRHGR